jgi:hypothetical protein
MRKSHTGYLAAGLIALGLLASACGGGSTPGVANLSGSQTGTSNSSNSSSGNSSNKQFDALKFSQCMRKHGVTNFPDPSSSGGGISLSSGNGIDPNSPTFQTAQKACQSLLPKPSAAQQRQAEQNALKFSQCMRAHGVTNFPDPQFNNSGGGIGIKISAGGGSGLDPNSPTFKTAQNACAKLLHLPGGGPTHTNGSAPGNGQSVFVG